MLGLFKPMPSLVRPKEHIKKFANTVSVCDEIARNQSVTIKYPSKKCFFFLRLPKVHVHPNNSEAFQLHLHNKNLDEKKKKLIGPSQSRKQKMKYFLDNVVVSFFISNDKLVVNHMLINWHQKTCFQK